MRTESDRCERDTLLLMVQLISINVPRDPMETFPFIEIRDLLKISSYNPKCIFSYTQQNGTLRNDNK